MCGFMKGMGLGLMLDIAAGVGFTADKRRCRMVHRAARSMGDMAERMADALGM